jgi:hypothetical protein
MYRRSFAVDLGRSVASWVHTELGKMLQQELLHKAENAMN